MKIATFTLDNGLTAIEKIQPIRYTAPVIIGVDPSKKGYAVTALTQYDSHIETVLFSGTGMHTTDFCKELRKSLYTYLGGVEIAASGVEDKLAPIDDYSENKNRLPSVDDILGEIKYATKQAFYEILLQDSVKLDHTLHFINNKEWKKAMIPNDINKLKNGKVSKMYLASINPIFKDVADDITDSILIAMFTRRRFSHVEEIIMPLAAEKPLKPIKYRIFCKQIISNSEDIGTMIEFNKKLTLSENIAYVRNRDYSNAYYFRIPKSLLTLEDIQCAERVYVVAGADVYILF